MLWGYTEEKDNNLGFLNGQGEQVDLQWLDLIFMSSTRRLSLVTGIYSLSLALVLWPQPLPGP